MIDPKKIIADFKAKKSYYLDLNDVTDPGVLISPDGTHIGNRLMIPPWIKIKLPNGKVITIDDVLDKFAPGWRKN